MTLSMMLGALLLVAVASFWHASLAARELANRVAFETCERAEVQMLDGTVSFHRLGLSRPDGGNLALQRTYVFEYTEDGFNRRRGFVVVAGLRVESVGLGPRAV